LPLSRVMLGQKCLNLRFLLHHIVGAELRSSISFLLVDVDVVDNVVRIFFSCVNLENAKNLDNSIAEAV
jgi:hypothetical protein